MKAIYQRISALLENNRAFAICTVLETKGSTPRHSAKMLVLDDGSSEFTIGGGPAEKHVIDQAIEAIRFGKSRTVDAVLIKGREGSLNAECGGSMKVLIEVLNPRPLLVVIGAGHVNRQLFLLADRLGYDTVVIDDRISVYEDPVFSNASQIYFDEDIQQAVQNAVESLSPNCAIVIATKDADEKALRGLKGIAFDYVGVIGSKRKVGVIRDNLLKDGWDEHWVEKVYMPIGLDIGAETPEEIAISIWAEILMTRQGKSGRSLFQKNKEAQEQLIWIRGAGDIATGIGIRLLNAGYRIIFSEVEKPSCIRRTVAFAQAVYEGETIIEGYVARHCPSIDDAFVALKENKVPIITTDEETLLSELRPVAFVEATLRKTRQVIPNQPKVRVAIGPGYTAPQDVDAVIESMRGHQLGRVIKMGEALPNTGIPGVIDGYGIERVIYAPAEGKVHWHKSIGDQVSAGECIGEIETFPVLATIDGMLRGLIVETYDVHKGMKIADIDPRGCKENCYSVSDKALAIGGGVLEILNKTLIPVK